VTPPADLDDFGDLPGERQVGAVEGALQSGERLLDIVFEDFLDELVLVAEVIVDVGAGRIEGGRDVAEANRDSRAG
jgi:hypothetical protein